jgi:hypothetical protein
MTYRQITLGACILSAACDGGADDGSDWMVSLGAGEISGGGFGHGGGSGGEDAAGGVDGILHTLDGRLDRVPLNLKRRHCWLRSNRHLAVPGIWLQLSSISRLHVIEQTYLCAIISSGRAIWSQVVGVAPEIRFAFLFTGCCRDAEGSRMRCPGMELLQIETRRSCGRIDLGKGNWESEK